MRLNNKVAFITGASSGIGAACAQRFANEGAVVVGFDLGEAPNDGEGQLAGFHAGDVRDETGVAAAVQATVAERGRIDILVNAAGVAGGAPIHVLEQDEWDRVVDINLKGTFLVTKHVIASAMLEQRSGSIINLASIEGVEGMDVASAYNASKGGVVLLTRQIAVDYGRIGIRSNCLCPGFIETPMTAMLRSPGLEAI
ncbi:MAG: SDR family NAD(P)-dependent oxidoreductase, partial [Acidimicrobiales bacterium]